MMAVGLRRGSEGRTKDKSRWHVPVHLRPLLLPRRSCVGQAEALFIGPGATRLKRMCPRVASELLLVVTVATVLLGRGALTLALVDNEIGQEAEFAQISDVVG